MKIFAAALMTLLMLLSCSPEDETTGGVPAGSGDDQITLTDLDINGLYAIFPQHNSRNLLRSASEKLFLTNGGTYLHFAEESSFSFYLKDIGLTDGDSVKVITLEPESDGTVIDIRNDGSGDTPLFTNEDGQDVYEEYYRVNLGQNVADKNEVAIMVLKDGGGHKVDTDYGIFLPGKSSSFRDRSSKGVMDLSGYTDVYLYNQVHIEKVTSGDGKYTRELKLMTPVDLKLDLDEAEAVRLESPGIYRVKTDGLDSDKEYVIEIKKMDTSDMDFKRYHMSTSTMDPRTVEGYHRPYVFPISYDGDSIIVYIGKPVEDLNISDNGSKDFIFNFQKDNGSYGGEATLREISEDENKHIEKYIWDVDENHTEKKITIPGSGEGVIPIIVRGDEAARRNKTLRLGIEGYSGNDIQLRILCSHIPNGAGYSQSGLLGDGETYEIDSGSCLEYMFLWYRNIEEGEKTPEITLSLT